MVRRVKPKFGSITFSKKLTRVCDQPCQFTYCLHIQRFVGIELNSCGTRKHVNTLNFCMCKGVTSILAFAGAPFVVYFSVPYCVRVKSTVDQGGTHGAFFVLCDTALATFNPTQQTRQTFNCHYHNWYTSNSTSLVHLYELF